MTLLLKIYEKEWKFRKKREKNVIYILTANLKEEFYDQQTSYNSGTL